jgi:hypothetical protein
MRLATSDRRCVHADECQKRACLLISWANCMILHGAGRALWIQEAGTGYDSPLPALCRLRGPIWQGTPIPYRLRVMSMATGLMN